MIMISTINMILMVTCVLISIVALAVPYIMINRRSGKLETGLPGAVGYGLLGYIWQYIIYMFLGMYLMRMPVFQNMDRSVALVAANLLLTLVSTVCTAVSLYWGIYLTNQKQLSVYRSAGVGIGFSLGKIGIDLIYPYIYSLYFSVQINNGTYAAAEDIKESIVNTTPLSLISGTYKCLLMFVIIFVIALIMGKYYISKNKKMAWFSVLVIYEVIMLLNVALKYMFGDASDIAMIIVFTIIAAAGVLILYNWFKNDEVEVNPLAILNRMKK